MNQKIKEALVSGIGKAAKELKKTQKWKLDTLPEIELELPKDAKHGDVSTNIAMVLAKRVKSAPRNLAQSFLETFEKKKIFTKEFVDKIEIAGPGFVNFYLSEKVIYEELHDILNQGDLYGRAEKRKNEKIHIEFVSANPTGPLNIVSARAAAVGDALARIMDAVGYEVDKEFYINDAGNQVRLLGKSVEARFRELFDEKVEFPEEGYHGEYIKDIAKQLKEKYGDEPLTWSREKREEQFGRDAIEINLKGQKEILKQYRVEFDQWFSEREMRSRKENPLERVKEQLSDWNATYENEGALWFSSTEYGDDKDRVLVTKEGEPTYFLADIAYHKDKALRHYDKIIVLMGPDHHGYYPRVLAAMDALGYKKEKFEFRLIQQVNLLKDGENVKMSKRAGKIIEMKDLLDEVHVDAARYFFVLRKLDSPLDFDIDLAKEQSSNNPVYYVQYAHARIVSIFVKYQEETKEKLPLNWKKVDLTCLKEKEEMELIKMLVHFPDLLEGAAEVREPLRVPNYLKELCSTFHSFYTKHRVRVPEVSIRSARLALLEATRIVIHNGLALLGVSSPNKM